MIAGFNLKNLRNIEALASEIMRKENKSAKVAYVEAARTLRDTGNWVSDKKITPSKVRTAFGAKKIAGEQKPLSPAPQTKTFEGKQYQIIKEVKTKAEVNKEKMNCENACFYIKTVKPTRRGDTYKLYGRKKSAASGKKAKTKQKNEK